MISSKIQQKSTLTINTEANRLNWKNINITGRHLCVIHRYDIIGSNLLIRDRLTRNENGTEKRGTPVS